MHENNSPLVTDRSDPRYSTLVSVQTFQGRNKTNRYLIEGIRHVARAFEEHAPMEMLFIEPSTLENPFGRKLARRICQSGISCLRICSNLYRRLTLAAEPQGIGAMLTQRWRRPGDIVLARDPFWLAVESVDLPGNLGTMIRTAEAAGASGLIFLGNSADPHDPACVRATMGALFSQKLVRCSVREFMEWTRAHGVTVVGSSPRGLLNYRSFRCNWPAVLVIGSEREGLSEQMKDACSFVVRIPMQGRSDSVNAAVAAGILLFEMSAQSLRNR